MPVCHHNAPNGEKSLLYQQLEQKYGPEMAHDVWEQVRSQQFLNKWNWMDDSLFSALNRGKASAKDPYKVDIGLDVNGEPTLEEVEKRLKLTPPFKPANKEQAAAIQAIQDFIRSGNPEEWLMVEGKAGTGKTTIVQEAIAPFIKEGRFVMVSALSHKAKLVLTEKLAARFGETSTIKSHTIAGALAMQMDVETGKFSPEFGSYERPIEDPSIIIVDEASMVNEEALDLIMEAKRSSAKVIFLGDIGQLPPIREKTDFKHAQRPSPTFNTPNKVKLLERVRQGEESPILPYADLFWNNSQSKQPVENPAPQEMRKSTVTSKGSLVFAKSGSALTKVLPLYKKGVETGNPDIVKTVVYKNTTRQVINNKVREYIFGGNAAQFLKGDLLMFQDNYKIGRKTISNSSEIQVKRATQTTTPDGWKVWELGFTFDGEPMDMEVLASEEQERFKKHLDDLGNQAKSFPRGSGAAKDAWKVFWREKARFGPVDYSYAITSHKSQGSTYDVVLVGEADIMSVGPIGGKEKSQSIYTAITRARHLAIVMDGRNDDEAQLDAALYFLDNPVKEPIKAEPPVPVEEKEETLPEITPEQIEKALKSKPIPQRYRDKGLSVDGIEMRTRVPGRTSMGMIRLGERTETTRSSGQFRKPKKGDLLVYEGDGKKVLVRVTTDPYKPNKTDFDRYEGWADEQWERSSSRFTDKWFSYRFEYLGDVVNGEFVPKEGASAVKPPPVPQPSSDPLQPVDAGTTPKKFGEKAKKYQLAQFIKDVAAFYQAAAAAPEKKYRVTTADVFDPSGKKLSARQIAQVLDSDAIPANVVFEEDMTRLIENTPRRIVAGFKNDTPVEFISRDEDAVMEAAEKLLIPKLDAQGNRDGFFTPQQQKEIVDSLVALTERLLRRDPALKANAVLRAVKLFHAKQQQLLDSGSTEMATMYMSIFNARREVTEQVLRQLSGLGLRTDTRSVDRILAAVETLEPLTEEEKLQFQTANPDINLEEQDLFTGEFLESTGRIARDWSDNTFELDPKDTASARIKMFIGTLYEYDRGVYTVDENGFQVPQGIPVKEIAAQANRRGLWAGSEEATEKLIEQLRQQVPRLPKQNFLGIGKVADYEQVFREVLNQLGNRPQDSSFEEFMAVLDDHPDPTINELAAQLKNADQSMKNEFMTVMMKQYQPFIMALFNVTTDFNGKSHFVLNPVKSNRYNQRDTLIKQWQQQQLLGELTILSPSKERVLDIDRIQSRWLPILDKARKINDWSTPANRKFFISTMGSILRVSGIGVTDEMMEDLYKNPKKWGQASVSAMFGVSANGEPSGLFSIFILKSAGLTNADQKPDPMERLRQAQLNNPLHTENSLMQDLARLVAKYTPVLYSTNHRNSEGKSVWDWGLNTKLSHQFRSFLEDFDGFDRVMQQVDITQDNYLLQILKENRSQLEDMELSYFDGLRPSWGTKGTTRQMMSDREQLLTSILLFQNRGNGFNRKSKVNFMSLTHGDKTMTPIFHNMPRVATGRFGVMPADVLGREDSLLNNVFKSEWKRIVRQADVDSGNPEYEKGKGLFFFLPDFNYESMQAMVEEGFLTDAEFKTLWVGGEQKLTPIIDSERELKVINKILNRFVFNLVSSTLNKWKANGIITEEDHMFDKQYTEKLYKENAMTLVRNSGAVLDAQGKAMDPKEVNKIIAGTAAKDYAINQFLFNTALSQLFYGDPAQAYKASKVGNTTMDHIVSTFAEYTKRLAKDIAPRADLYWRPDQRTYNTITLSDVKTREKYLQEIEELREVYAEKTGTSTDAQELITVQEALDVLLAAGKISQRVHGEMSTIIREADGGYYEFTLPEHKAVIMQPQKPVYAGSRTPVKGALLQDYVKTSAYALYPPLTKGMELDKLRVLMETHGVQRADFPSGRKLGSPHQPLQVFAEDGTFLNPSEETVRASIRKMNRSGFGIQQEVPYEEDKEAIKTITQMNDGLTESIGHITDFKLPGKGVMDGKALKAHKEKVRKEMIRRNLQKFRNRFNIDEEGTIDPEYIFDLMAEEAQKDTRNSYTFNEIQSLLIRDQDGTPMVPLLFNTAADKFESMLMGMVNRITEVKMPGKSYIQASGTGMTFKDEAEATGIVRIGTWDGSPLKTLRIEEGVVKPAQVILPWNFFDENGNRIPIEDFVQDGKIDPSRIPASLLQLIGARIPNQGHSSMLPLEVVGFVPSNMGDIIFVPSAIVKQMGADFDVDKLYTYKRPYYYNKDTGELSLQADYTERLGADAEEWRELSRRTKENLKAAGEPETDGFYEKRTFNKYLAEVVREKYPDGNVPKHISPSKTQSDEGLQSDYFDIHWAVLTHKDMLAKILKPLDKSDLKDESRKLAPKRGQYFNFYDPMFQLDNFQTGKEAKKLVGTSSWAVKFNARIQDKDLRYGTVQLEEEGGITVPVNVNAFIEVIDEHTGQIRRVGRLSGTGVSYYTEQDGAPLSDEVKKTALRTKGDNHVLVQSEAVDNMKDRTLDNLNLNPETYKAVQALIELQTEDGWAMNSKYWTRLLTQPIIQEFSREMKQGNDSLSQQYDPFLYQTVISKLVTKYTEALQDKEAVVEPIRFSPQSLLQAPSLEGDTFIHTQLAALRLFNELYQIGNRMFELEALFNQDVNGAGRDLFTVMDKVQQLSDIEQLPILGAEGIYQGTEIGYIFDTASDTALDVVGSMLPYRSMMPLFNQLAAITGRRQLGYEHQRKIVKAFRSFAYTAGQSFWADPQAERVRLLYGEESLAKRVAMAKNGWGSSNPMLQRLTVNIGAAATDPDFVEYPAGSKILATEKQNMTTGWLHLLLSTDDQQRQLGEDLLRYAYLTGGVQDANSFVEFVPASYVASTELTGTLKDLEFMLRSSPQYSNSALLTQYLQHHPELAIQVKPEDFGELEPVREFPESFVAPSQENPNHEHYKLADNYVPFLSFRSRSEGRWILYMYNPQGETPYYTRIDTLGNQYSDEYNGLVGGGQRSIFSENRALSDLVPGIDPVADIHQLGNAMPLQDKGNARQSFYEQIGLRPGGQPELDSALQTMTFDRELPQYLRTVAKFFKQVSESKEDQESQKLFQILGRPLIIQMGDAMGMTAVSHTSNEMIFDPRYVYSKREAAIVFLHELSHNKLQRMVLLAGHDARAYNINEETTRYFKQSVDHFRRQFPEVVRHMDELERIRYEAFNALRQQWGEERFQAAKRLVDGMLPLDEDGQMLYGLHSLQEFVAHVMTDTQVQSFLNGVTSSKGGTILDRVWSLLASLLQAIGTAIGMDIKKDGLLREALFHVMKSLDRKAPVTDITSLVVSGGTHQVETESQAEDLSTLLRTTYGKQVEMTQTPLGWNLNISNQYRKRAVVPGQRGRVLDKLYAQQSDIYDAINREQDVAKRVQLRMRQRELREQITELEQTTDLKRIYDVGKKQLAWVDHVIDNPSPSVVDVNLALNVTRLWENLIDTLYGDLPVVNELSKDFADLQIEAQRRRIALSNDKAPKVLTEVFRPDVTMTPLDFRSKLTDIDGISANVLALTRAKPLLVQATAVLGFREANNRDEHIGRVVKQLHKLEERMKASGMDQSMMLQFDEESQTWGLVNRLSAQWYGYRTAQRRFLHDSLEGLDKNTNLDEKERGRQKFDSWNKYWNELKRSSVFVDTRLFFDRTDGSRLQGPEVDAAMAKLVTSVGSETYAKELLLQAEKKYKDYMIEREIMKEWLDTHTELTAEEIQGKTREEQDKILDNKKAEAMAKWLQYNSPIDLLDRLDKGKNVNFNSEGDQWIVITPKASMKDYFDQNFQKIESNKEWRAIYEEYKLVLEEMISYLPMNIQRGIPSNFLPIVPKDTAGLLATIFHKIKNWDTEMLKAIAATDAEEQGRLRPDKIPVMYTEAFGQTRDVENRSRDMIRMLELFSMMALQHRYMGNVLDTINISENVLRSVNQRRIDGHEEGKPLRNVIDALKYYKDALVFKKPKELQGKIDSPIYSINPAEQLRIQRKIKDLIKEKESLNKVMEAKMDEGDFNHEEEEKRIDEIDKELSGYEKDARNIYGSKLIDTLISINQLKALSYNPFSAVANYTFAEVALSIYARGRSEIDPRTLRQATGVMLHSTKKYLLFGDQGDPVAQKVHAIMDRVGIMGDIVDTDYGTTTITNRKESKVKKAVKPYNWLRAGDYYTKGKLVVAMLKKKEVEVTLKATGEKKKLPLWDILNQEGRWDTDLYELQPEWDSVNIFEQTQWNQYRDRIRKTSMMVFGNQDKNAPVMARKNWIWRLAGQFRLSWFPEGIATRWKQEYFDINLGRKIKGRWRTYQDIGILASGMVVAKQLLASLPGVKVNPFEGQTVKDSTGERKPLMESEVDMENMRRNFAGLAWTVGITASILLLRSLGDDDEHKKGKSARQRQLLINMLIRNQQDLMLYSSPSVFNTISGNFLPASQVIVDYVNAMKATGHYLFGDTEGEKDAFERWFKKMTRAGLPHPSFALYNKVETMMTRDLDKLQR